MAERPTLPGTPPDDDPGGEAQKAPGEEPREASGGRAAEAPAQGTSELSADGPREASGETPPDASGGASPEASAGGSRDAPGGGPVDAAAGPETAPGRPAHVGVLADLALVGVCAWFLWRDFAAAEVGQVAFQARPWTFMLNLTATFVVAHRGLALVQRGVHDRPVRRGLGVLKWLAAFGLPLLVATGLERKVQSVHRANIDVLAADLSARTQRAIHQRGHVEPADLASVESPYLSSLSVRADTGEFLLQVYLPGVDIDGYTGFWASTEGRWHVHPTDAPPERPPAFDTSGPVLACNPIDVGLTCQ